MRSLQNWRVPYRQNGITTELGTNKCVPYRQNGITTELGTNKCVPYRIGCYDIAINSFPSSTLSPSFTCTFLTIPDLLAKISFSIFIASKIIKVWSF